MSFPILFRVFCALVIMVSGLMYLVQPEESSTRLAQTLANVEEAHRSIADSFCIEVRGNKFHWNFTYPGPDGVLHTADDSTVEQLLRIPPQKSVTFHLTSDDYVYILGIPVNDQGSQSVEKLREIAVPDLVHYMEYQSGDFGNLDLMVDPLCGFKPLHDPLMGKIMVTDDYDYQELLPAATGTVLKQGSHSANNVR